MSEFVLHPQACADLDDIWEYIAAGCPMLAFFARVGFHGGQFLGVLILSGMTKSEAHLGR